MRERFPGLDDSCRGASGDPLLSPILVRQWRSAAIRAAVSRVFSLLVARSVKGFPSLRSTLPASLRHAIASDK
jgi:hypothetical protein